jgi:hypothetical protein
MWIITLGQGLEAVRLRLQWNVDQCEASYDRLSSDLIWSHPSFLSSDVDAVDIRGHLRSISIEWEDPAHYMRWRSAVDVAQGSSRGVPAPNGGEVFGFVAQDLPLINNDQPLPIT